MENEKNVSTPRNKKKSPAIFFLICFAAALVVTIIVNSQSVLFKQISIPLNNGMAKLSTIGNLLTAVSLDNKVYVFEWNDFSKKYNGIPVLSDQTIILNNGTIVSVEKYNSKLVSLTRPDGAKKEFPIKAKDNKSLLNFVRNTNELLLTIAQPKSGEPNRTTVAFYKIDTDKDFMQSLLSMDLNISFNRRMNAAVSDDGSLIAFCGAKNGRCWLAICDRYTEKIVSEIELEAPAVFYNCVFSPDAKFIYARGSDSTAYKFQTQTGELIGRFCPTKENKNMERNQNVQLVSLSGDGKLLAATVSGAVYVWDTDSGKKIFTKGPGHKLVSSIAFSPDSRFRATADLRQGGMIKIWKLPKR